ncbi:MAG TPA: ABC transporter permease [Fibrobacteria bacterium]|nr:ABC transporter permease [Fibrobacteria bacterium]
MRPEDLGYMQMARELVEHGELFRVFLFRQISIRYAQTALGALWVVLQPTMFALIYSLVFGVFAAAPSEGKPYFLFSYCGTVAWTLFAQGIERAGTSFIQDERLVTKTWFPRLLLPFAAASSVLLDVLVAITLLFIALPFFGGFTGWSMLLAIPALLILLMLALGAGTLLAAINVRWRDIRQATPTLVQVLVWVTPVAYPLVMVPESMRSTALANPLAAPILLFRHAMIGTTPPPAWSLAWSAAVAVALLLWAIQVFRRVERTLADHI